MTTRELQVLGLHCENQSGTSAPMLEIDERTSNLNAGCFIHRLQTFVFMMNTEDEGLSTKQSEKKQLHHLPEPYDNQSRSTIGTIFTNETYHQLFFVSKYFHD